MNNEMMVQVPEQVLNEISNNLNTISAVTEFAKCQSAEINTNSPYINVRVRAFEGIFNLMTAYLRQLDNQLQEIIKTSY